MSGNVQGFVKVVLQREADFFLFLFAEILGVGRGATLVVSLVDVLELLKVSQLFLLGLPLAISSVISFDDDDDSDENGREENGDDNHDDTDDDVFVVAALRCKRLHRYIGVGKGDL
jgi:hypothetical protein